MAAQAPDFDLLARNGRVLDGTGDFAFPADVGIRDEDPPPWPWIHRVATLRSRALSHRKETDTSSAYIALRLAERGVLDLDRALHAYEPSSRMAHDPRYRRITARMVLSHSTGLPNWGGDTLELAFDPGTAFRYSGEGYVYLQRLIESLTGLPLQELARREVLEPLGMRRTSYVWEEGFEEDAVVGHDAAGRAGPPGAATRPTTGSPGR